MKTLFITGHDTEIGKTRTMSVLTHLLSQKEEAIQVVKLVETGIDCSETQGDIAFVLNKTPSSYVSGHTLFSFKAPLAPLTAAKKAGKHIDANAILARTQNLPPTKWRLFEGAGGLAVPFDENGFDGRDMALALKVDYLVLVIENRLGAINQARMLEAYAPTDQIKTGFWINDRHPADPAVTASNLEALSTFKTPIWGHLGYNESIPKNLTADFLSN